MEYRIVRPDGTVVNVLKRGQTSFHEDGRPLKSFGTIQDTTELKKASEELRKNKEMLNQVIDTVPQSIFWKDRQGRYLWCNRVFASAAGFETPGQLIGLTDHDLGWPPEDADACRADDREVMETKLTIFSSSKTSSPMPPEWAPSSPVPMGVPSPPPAIPVPDRSSHGQPMRQCP